MLLVENVILHTSHKERKMKMNNNIIMTSTDKKMYLKNIRNEFGMNQRQFAEILGIQYETYRKYEEMNSGSRNISDKLFEDVIIKIKRYEDEHPDEITGKIIISRYLENNRDSLFPSFFTRKECEIANIMLHNVLDIIKDIEKRSKVPYLKVRK